MQRTAYIKNRYIDFRNHNYPSREALNSAKIAYTFERLQILGFVCFTVEEDAFSDEFVTDNRVRLRCLKEGCWGIVARVCATREPKGVIADSVWQFIGNDWEYSGYDTDIKRSAIELLFNMCVFE